MLKNTGMFKTTTTEQMLQASRYMTAHRESFFPRVCVHKL
jgi:hypothetical protein